MRVAHLGEQLALAVEARHHPTAADHQHPGIARQAGVTVERRGMAERHLGRSGIQYEEQGLTIGFGLPLLAQVSLSSLNVGLTFGQRSIPTGIWKEQFIGARVSIILAPSNFEKWFRKRQLD